MKIGGPPGTRFTEQEVLNLLHGPLTSVVSGVNAPSDDTTAVRVVASSTPCHWVDLVVTGGLVAIGDSSAVATSGSEQGIILYPGNLPYRIFIDDLTNLWVAGATGTRLCFVYLADQF